MSHSSSASDGEVTEPNHKANSAAHHDKHAINGSNRVSGFGASSDSHGSYSNTRDRGIESRTGLNSAGRGYRSLSRSASPYRRKRTRSPSPYRRSRNIDRSPSPYRRNRDDRNHDNNDSRTAYKRKGSPPRGHRPDKRQHTDRGRHVDDRSKSSKDGGRMKTNEAGLSQVPSTGNERPSVKPVSYAELEKPNAVPNFQSGLPLDAQSSKTNHGHARNGHRQAPPPQHKLPKSGPNIAGSIPRENEDVEMKSPEDDKDYTLEPAVEKVPTQESREEKRRRWAAIRAAADQQKSKESLLQQAVLGNASEVTTPNTTSFAASPISPLNSPRTGDLDSVPASPDVMVIDKDGLSRDGTPSAASPSAADYDPMQDMLDDRDRAARKTHPAEVSSDAYRETDPKVLSTLPAEKVGPVKKQKKEFDMFADSDDEEEDQEAGAEHELSVNAKGTVLDEKLLDNWDDIEGYYKLISNELVHDGRYRIIKGLGRGVFANVAQAEEVRANENGQAGKLVAIKMIRRNDLMRKASQKEMEFLRKVNEADPHDKRHIIRLLGSFDHKGHLCIVFEHMSKNLRDLLKEETNGHGLALPAVRTYAKQMFLGLQHLQNCQVIHLDLKPDNVLVSPDKKTIKLADFGTAVDKRDQVERTEYLVSRFYRAPEIILGMEIGYPCDMWAVGCTVYELWTGKILFAGRSNNQMIKAFMDCLGWPSEKLLKKGLVNNVLENFELGPPLKFISREVDQNGQLSVRKIEQQKKISRDMKTRVHDAARGITTQGPSVTELNDLSELLSACLHMNVEKRMTPKEALVHKFFVSKSFTPKVAASSAVVKPAMMKRGTPGFRR